jgi:hypothetical protein
MDGIYRAYLTAGAAQLAKMKVMESKKGPCRDTVPFVKLQAPQAGLEPTTY